ncbi:unnamed protein product [Clonostachys rosea f. rosea IK726]|uniref:Uncharacterized protein n=1 Tax=Clonostachys rosea f. rosea IK726 TaxID=1349383 RepID=A0ACA9TWM8_BIOOC|nr:unnamed protein product [Clonostachys rosea f. rosea IK726]
MPPPDLSGFPLNQRSVMFGTRYVRDHTNIPVPRVYGYGRYRLRRDTSAHQVFIVLDYIDGQPLTKKSFGIVQNAAGANFSGKAVDLYSQLQRLKFPRGGSLMPHETVGAWYRLRKFIFPEEEYLAPQSSMDLEFGPRIVGAFSMRKNELQVDGYTAPRFIAATAKEFLEEQYRLLQAMWRIPSEELGRQEAEREEFALHALSFEEAQKTFGLKADSPGDSFYLPHPDLRVDNIIVDDKLHIQGVIDWEFSVTVPQHAFLPPSWITGHDTGSIYSKVDFSSEFMSALSSMRQQSPSHSQLAEAWDSKDDSRLPMAYIFLDPSHLVLLFYRCIYPRLYNKPRDEVVPSFFHEAENKELLVGLETRLLASERYT